MYNRYIYVRLCKTLLYYHYYHQSYFVISQFCGQAFHFSPLIHIIKFRIQVTFFFLELASLNLPFELFIIRSKCSSATRGESPDNNNINDDEMKKYNN